MRMVAEWYYRTSTGQTKEPVTAARLKQLAQLGEIGPATEIRKGTEGRWITANKVKGLLDAAPPKPTTTKTTLPAWMQPLESGREPEPARPRPKSPAPLVRRPHADAEPVEEDDRPVPVRRAAPWDVVDAEYTVSSPAKKRSPFLSVWAGVGGTLLAVGLVAVAFTMFGKKDENQPQQQQAVQNEKQKDAPQKGEPHSTKDNSPAAVGTAISQSLSIPDATVKGYLAAGTWEERLPYVLNADRVRQEMAKLYRNTPSFKAEDFLPGTITAVENRNAPVGGQCTVTVDVSTSSPNFPRWTYNLVRTPEGFKIDWEASQEQRKKEQNEALQAKLRELNPFIDIEVLRCKQSNSRTEIEFRLTNKSTALFSYVAVTLSIHNDKDEYLGNDYTNATNVRAGQSIVKSISFDNVKVGEVALWKMGIKDVIIDRGDGERTEATSVFTLKEQVAGPDKGYKPRLEEYLAGHWREANTDHYFSFASPNLGVIVVHKDVRRRFSLEIVERNYSTGIVKLRYVNDDGSGQQMKITFKNKTTVTTQLTHIHDDGGSWREFKNEVQAKLVSDWAFVDNKESP